MCTNIELFDEYTGSVLAKLYQNFPIAIDLGVDEISGHTQMNDFGVIVNEKGKESKHAQVAWHTIQWLKNAGYIHIETQYPYTGYHGCVLTAKGLEVLKATPESVQPQEYLGDQLVSAAKNGTTATLKEAAKQAISTGIKLAMG